MSNMSLNCEGDTEQTQKLLQAREIEWEARPKKKSPPLVTSGVELEMSPKMFRWMSCLATFLVVDEWVGMTNPVSDLQMLKTLLTGFLSINIYSFVDLPNSTNTLVICCFLRCKNYETWKTSTIFCFLCLSSSCPNQTWFCEAKLFFGIFLCCCFPFSFFCPWQEKIQRPKGHYWCDLSDSGLSKADLLNITDCSTSHLGREVRFWVCGGWWFFVDVSVGCWVILGGVSGGSKGGVGSCERAHGSQDWEIIPWWTSMGVDQLSWSLQDIDVAQLLRWEKNNLVGLIQIFFCMPERKNKYRCYRCIYLCTKLAAVLPCMLKNRDEESFWKTGSSPTSYILSLVTSSEPWCFPPPLLDVSQCFFPPALKMAVLFVVSNFEFHGGSDKGVQHRCIINHHLQPSQVPGRFHESPQSYIVFFKHH